jgi:CubicO group peptidase (beta-lactamase class C family)
VSELERACGPLRDLVADAIAQQALPAVGIGVVRGGERFSHVAGVCDVLTKRPVNEDSRFQIASATKTFTALALMRLAEQGRVELDAPVRDYLPDFRVADGETSAQMTHRHVLTHRAGFEGDCCCDTGGGDDALARAVASMTSVPQVHPAPAGALWSYCNSGYYLAGRAIEVLTGRSYEDALQALVLEPLGLAGTSFERDRERCVEGHQLGPAGVTVNSEPELPRAMRCIVGLSCTLGDLLDYLASHLPRAPAHTVDRRAELPPVPCTLYRDDRIAVLPETAFERWGRLLRDPDGSVRWLLMHGRAHARA